MIREEQAKKECAIVVSDDMEQGTPFAAGYNKGIEKGVRWADAHPNWHKFPEKRPSETQPSNKKYYAACYDAHDKKSYTDCFEWNGREFGRYTDIPIYDRNYEKVVAVQHEWESYSRDIIAWMELPEPPKSKFD